MPPSLAWDIIWRGPNRFRFWGYVMWDDERVERNGTKELMVTRRESEEARRVILGRG